jgi:hypothetical protein
MVALAEAFVRVRPDLTGFRGEVEREIDRVNFDAVGQRKGVEFGDGAEKGSRGKLGPVGERRGREFTDGFSKGSDSGFSNFVTAFSRPLGAIVANLPAFTLFSGAALAATASVVRFGAAIAPAVGVLAAVPAGAVAGAAALGILDVALHNVGAAISAGLSDDAKKFAKATKDMGTETLGAVNAVVAFRPELVKLQQAISNAFFVGFRADIQALAASELPTLRGQVIGISGEFGQMGQRVLEFVAQSQTVDVLRGALLALRATIDPITPSIQPILSIFRDLVAVGSIFLPSLTAGFDGAAQRAAAFVAQARQTGQLREFIQGGIDVLGQLGSVFGALGGIASSVFRAMQAGGGDALGALSQLLHVFDAVLATKAAQDALVTVFRALSTISGALGSALVKVLEAVLPLVPPLAELAAKVGVALADAVIRLIPLITTIVTKLSDWAIKLSETKGLFSGFVSAVGESADFLNDHHNILAGLVLIYGSYRLALLANAAAHTVSQIATKASILAEQAHNVAKTISTSLIGTWIGVKALEAAAWVRSTVVAGAATIAQAANTTALFIATGGIQAWVIARTASIVAWVTSTVATVANTVATVANTVATTAARVGVVLMTAAQYALGVAVRFALGPIGIAITVIAALAAAVIYAYNHSETFRNVVQAVWAAVKTAISVAWDAIKTAFAALVTFVTATIPNAFQSMLSYVTDRWNGMRNAINTGWLAVKGMWTDLVTFVTVTIPNGFASAVANVSDRWTSWRNMINTGWLFVRGLWTDLVNFVTVTIPNAFANMVNAVTDRWTSWRNTINTGWLFVKGLWSDLVNFITVTIPNAFANMLANVTDRWNSWRNMINVGWQAVKVIWNELINFVKVILVEAFRVAVAGIQTYWNTWKALIDAGWQFVKGVFNALKAAISGDLPGAFRTGVDAIATAWNKVRAAAREPVAFVVNQIINPLAGGFNKVADAVGLSVRIPTIGGFNTGGRIPGLPSMTDNRIASGPGGRDIAVASGEYIVNAGQTSKWLPVLEAINAGRFPPGRALANAYGDAYAGGGLIGGALDFGKNVLDAFTDPIKFIAAPLNALINRIPGGGLMRDIAVASGHKLVDAAIAKLKAFVAPSAAPGGGGAPGIGGNASPGFPPWPSSPSAQRGDSGVWRSIVALIRSTGPVSGAFGNSYRAGDPLWHGCVPMDTKIFTRRGWITHDQLIVGEDETIGYNPQTGKNEWTLIVGMHHYDDAEVWTLQNRWFRTEVTPGHKWLVDQQVSVQTETVCTECGSQFLTGRGMTKHRADVHHVRTPRRERYEEQLVETRDVKQSTRIHLSKPADLGDQLPITDDEAELIAWVMADGYMEPYGPTVVQSKPDQVRYLQGFMAKFPCSEYVREPTGRQNHTIYRWKLAFDYWNDLASRSKASKADALNFVLHLSVTQRKAFLRGFLAADGSRDTRTADDRLGYAAFQVSGPVAEAVKIAAYLEGYRPDTKVKTVFDADRYGTQPMEHIGFRTPVVKGRNLPVVDKRRTDVFCPTTTLGTWTARQGEEIFLTGNSGRAVDWMGFNQDALATFLASRGPLELIHRTPARDYAYTRGRNLGSFNQALMEQHRNHVHIAMSQGGLVVPARTSVADSGQLTLAPGANLVLNGTGRNEQLSATDERVAELLAAILVELGNVGPNVGKAITTASRAAVRTARAA